MQSIVYPPSSTKHTRRYSHERRHPAPPDSTAANRPVERDEKFIAALAGLLEQFCNELDLAERIVFDKGCWPAGLPEPEEEQV